MMAQIVGVLLAVCAGAAAGWRLAWGWSAPRLTPLKGGLLGGFAAAPFTLLLHLLGGGQLRFSESVGMIEWAPVVSTLITGGLCGVIAVAAVGLVRIGSRRPWG